MPSGRRRTAAARQSVPDASSAAVGERAGSPARNAEDEKRARGEEHHEGHVGVVHPRALPDMHGREEEEQRRRGARRRDAGETSPKEDGEENEAQPRQEPTLEQRVAHPEPQQDGKERRVTGLRHPRDRRDVAVRPHCVGAPRPDDLRVEVDVREYGRDEERAEECAPRARPRP